MFKIVPEKNNINLKQVKHLQENLSVKKVFFDFDVSCRLIVWESISTEVTVMFRKQSSDNLKRMNLLLLLWKLKPIRLIIYS
jgi:hypothetical protein